MKGIRKISGLFNSSLFCLALVLGSIVYGSASEQTPAGARKSNPASGLQRPGSFSRPAPTTPAKGAKTAPAAKPSPGLQRPGSFTRPKPEQGTEPKLPEADRSDPRRFFLERADILTSDQEVDSGRQVVKGNVLFRKQGVLLYCDSAYYFPNSVSLDAFGHVRMTQGDTLLVTADKINYNGLSQVARLRTNRGGDPVMLEHTSRADRTKKYLYTDSLDYSLRDQLASYGFGGRMYNVSTVTGARDTLTSRQGQYDARTRQAEVTDDVFLRNGGSRLRTYRLVYHTDSRIVDIVEPTSIRSGQDSIQTNSGFYNTITGNAQLLTRSLIVHRDSTGAATTLEGDSIVYDRALRRSEAFMYGSENRHPRPMVITDTARKAILTGGYGYYSDSTRTAYADRYPLLKEYSRPDTTFLRAERVMLLSLPDTAKTPGPDGVQPEYHVAKAWNRARVFRQDMQGVADSITYVTLDSLLYLDRKPIIWSGERMVAGSKIIVHMNDSTPESALLPAGALVAEDLGEGFYNQMRAHRLKALFEDGELRHIFADTDVQAVILPMENDSTYNKLIQAYGDSLTLDMQDREMKHLVLKSRQGSEVTGSVIPLLLLKRSQQYLPDFIRLSGAKSYSDITRGLEMLASIRPAYAWYRKGWEDGLGEISLDLEEYFTNPAMGIPDPGDAMESLTPLPR